MPTQEADILQVHCGRCGKPMVINLTDSKRKRVIDCEVCERKAAQVVQLAAARRDDVAVGDNTRSIP